MACKGLSSACASLCVHARACNICVGQRTENHDVGEGGVRCWWWNEFQTGTAFSPQGLPAPCGCCLGNGWGIMRNAWKLYPSFGLMDGVKGGGWLFSVYFFSIFSRLDRQVAVVTTWRRSPAHLHQNKDSCQHRLKDAQRHLFPFSFRFLLFPFIFFSFFLSYGKCKREGKRGRKRRIWQKREKGEMKRQYSIS